MKNLLLLCALLLALMAACSGFENHSDDAATQEIKPVIVNGVERSELALLMRRMYDEMKLVKDSIEKGHSVKTDFLNAYQKIQTAHATEPEKIDDAYRSMAESFLLTYQMFEQNPDNQVAAFNLMLQNCVVCHQSKCPGPVKTIKKLKIKG